MAESRHWQTALAKPVSNSKWEDSLNYEQNQKEEKQLIEKIVETKRVAKVVKGGRNFSFSAIVVVGDKKGKVGVGTGKANEIVDAIRKAKEKATKAMFDVPIVRGTIPHELIARYGASRVMLKPASPGTGVIAGGTARAIFEAAGIENILCKSLGSNTPCNVVKATVIGLKSMRTVAEIAKLRNKTIAQLTGQEGS
ncbi:MAG: 30S ribosomal protein S5 [Candidatus Cloacimonetes bacterium]|nr:30S ribosomal protein S5 [Candidatus Cloacimonadota bacterium]